jgi:hypothetical protein
MFCVTSSNTRRECRAMSQIVERTSFNLRYQACRLRSRVGEARLLASIAERGIEQPLAGIDTLSSDRLLLDGFKRFRCAAKLGIECVPYVSWGQEETQGIARLMTAAKQQSLSVLEQARFVTELLTVHGLSPAEVAELLARSKAWVSMRRGLLAEMSPLVQAALFAGRFPVYAYMSTLRPFMRMNGVGPDDVQRFVQAVAGQQLSLREIELLAQGYFRGPRALRDAVDQGRWKWSLAQLQAVPHQPSIGNEFERGVLRDLEQLLKSITRVTAACHDARLKTRVFFAQANLLLADLLGRRAAFFQILEEFYDRSGHAECHFSTAPAGPVPAADQPSTGHQPPHGADDRQSARPTHAARAQ